MKSVMRRAWKIRKESAKKFNCKVTEIDFSECLKLSWAEFKSTNVTELPSHACKADHGEVCFCTECMGATGSRFYSKLG